MKKAKKTSTLERMTEKLATRFTEILGKTITSNDIALYPATGYWRQSRADVMQFTGTVIIDDLPNTIGCWESMSDCLAYGFNLNDCRGEWRAEAAFVCSALDRRVNRSANWYSAVQLEEIEFQKQQADPTR
jgi:hypothetical protein